MNIPCDPDLIDQLRSTPQLQGTSPTGGFAFDIDLSVPSVVMAIHAGHRVREELLPLMQISEKGRLFEEDLATDRMIQGSPSAIWGLDSRTEYDLNRPSDLALPIAPQRFWGVQVYRNPPTAEMNRRSLEKYEAFYRFVGSCIGILRHRFGACVVYDIHSFNITRQIEKGINPPPTFNLGTALLDRTRWGNQVDQWLRRLEAIEITGICTTVAENKVYSGRGELCRRLTQWDPHILVLPTEIAKIYMDEREGILYPAVLDALGQGLRKAIADHARQFLQ